jgi:ketosteroid isomerase-like protein
MAEITIGTLGTEDIAAIRAVTDDWARLVVAREYDSLVARYTEDAVVMPPHQPAVHGRKAIREWCSEFPGLTAASFDIEEIDGRGDLAYVRGSYRMTIEARGAEAVEDVGKYIEIRKKQPDGSWLIAADIFNSDKP